MMRRWYMLPRVARYITEAKKPPHISLSEKPLSVSQPGRETKTEGIYECKARRRGKESETEPFISQHTVTGITVIRNVQK